MTKPMLFDFVNCTHCNRHWGFVDMNVIKANKQYGYENKYLCDKCKKEFIKQKNKTQWRIKQ